MKYNSYDELIALITNFRLEHKHLPALELNKLIKKTFRINELVLLEIDGICDLTQFP